MSFQVIENAPNECLVCDFYCEGALNCTPGYCYFVNITIVILFGIVGMVLLMRLVQFLRTSSNNQLVIKKLVFLFSVCFCIARSLRFHCWMFIFVLTKWIGICLCYVPFSTVVQDVNYLTKLYIGTLFT